MKLEEATARARGFSLPCAHCQELNLIYVDRAICGTQTAFVAGQLLRELLDAHAVKLEKPEEFARKIVQTERYLAKMRPS